MGVDELQRVKQLEDENRRLKQVVADLTLDKQIRRGALADAAPLEGWRIRSADHRQPVVASDRVPETDGVERRREHVVLRVSRG
jgi:hypothetical protein